MSKVSKYEVFYIFDKPVPYKELLIHPVRMHEYFNFHYCADCFVVDKNTDFESIQMGELEFIFKRTDDENNYISKLDYILRTVLEKKDVKIEYGFIQNRPFIKIEDVYYFEEDYVEIRRIVCEQNAIEMPDLTIPKEMRDRIEEAKRLRQKIGKNKVASLEDQLVCVMLETSLKLEDVYNLTIRKFSKILQRADAALHYKIYLAASMSGMVEFKDKSFIKHWLSDLDNSKKSSEILSLDDVKEKFGQGK